MMYILKEKYEIGHRDTFDYENPRILISQFHVRFVRPLPIKATPRTSLFSRPRCFEKRMVDIRRSPRHALVILEGKNRTSMQIPRQVGGNAPMIEDLSAFGYVLTIVVERAMLNMKQSSRYFSPVPN